MSTREQIPIKPAPATVPQFLTPAPFRTLQRKCACGGSEAGCEECKKKANLQRRVAAGTEPASVPSVVHEGSGPAGQPLDQSERTRLEPRAGHDFSRVRVHSAERATGSREGLRVTDANDASEIEADRIAGQLLRTSGEEWETAAPSSIFGVIHRAPSPAPSAATLVGGDVGPRVEQEIAGAASRGVPLGESTRSFFESRLGTDFGNVRIHSGAAAADVAAKLQADAFTLGHDVFFNRARYEPESYEGMKLLAHELVHVVQQGVGTVAQRLLQRSKISHRALTWADFKATPDMGSSWAALTASGFPVPGFTPKKDAVDTKKACTIGKKSTTEFAATVKVDPSVYDGVAAVMTQEESWVKPRYKDDGKAWCGEQATDCEKNFDQIAAQGKKDCKQNADNCAQAFKEGNTSYTLTVGSKKITATSAGECASKLQPECETAQIAGASAHTLDDSSGVTFASASTKADCRKTFLDNCKVHEAPESARLLKHEQGHFDISKVMADKARPSLKAKAATFTATETRCGKVEATNAAIASFNALNAPTVLDKLGSDWRDSEKKAQSDYDDQTAHGMKKPEQAAWETNIAGGLSGYDPTATPATPGSATQQTTPGPPPTTPTQNPPPKTP